MNFIVFLMLVLSSMLGIIWWQARPTDEDRFIQTAGTQQLTDYLKQKGHSLRAH